MNERVARDQLSVAKATLQAIAFGCGGDPAEIARSALTNMAKLASSASGSGSAGCGCNHCDVGIPRIKFNRTYQHRLENGDEVACTNKIANGST